MTPARRWSNAVAVGDDVQFTRPQGNFVVRDDAPYHVFAGEETASVAFAAMLRSLPPEAEVTGWSRRPNDPIISSCPGRCTGCSAATLSAKDSAVLAEALRALQLPDQPGVAYLAGKPAPSRHCARS